MNRSQISIRRLHARPRSPRQITLYEAGATAAGLPPRSSAMRAPQVRTSITQRSMKVAPGRLVRCAVDRGFLHDGLMIGEDGGAIGWIREIVLDCADPWRLARFWAGLLGGTPVEWYPGWVTLEPPPHGQRLSFQGTADWGAARSGSGRLVHFDILVTDLAAAHDRVVAAGATFAGEHVSPLGPRSGRRRQAKPIHRRHRRGR
jgi:hypothetical protein